MNTIVEGFLKDVNYDENKVDLWVNQICEACSRKFVDLRKPFKYLGRTHSLLAPPSHSCCGLTHSHLDGGTAKCPA